MWLEALKSESVAPLCVVPSISLMVCFSGIQAFIRPCNRGSIASDCWCWQWSACLCPCWSYCQGNWTLFRNKFLWSYPLYFARTCYCKFCRFTDDIMILAISFSIFYTLANALSLSLSLMNWTWNFSAALVTAQTDPHPEWFRTRTWSFCLVMQGYLLPEHKWFSCHEAPEWLIFLMRCLMLVAVEECTCLWPSLLASSNGACSWRLEYATAQFLLFNITLTCFIWSLLLMDR